LGAVAGWAPSNQSVEDRSIEDSAVEADFEGVLPVFEWVGVGNVFISI